MTTTPDATLSDHTAQAQEPAPAWLVRLTLGSVALAALSGSFLLWAKWGTVLAMGEDILKYCF